LKRKTAALSWLNLQQTAAGRRLRLYARIGA
jgi:hypothetical protein